ncbi:MFS general substrate transporter [Lindgomyces ingoldianus]|uniref:MFS general substrate transporter n=1 Tax=Lindgomyces ingoldianus TaxID=673940 RepID=A0ACB6R014_9PLEO|nr:MFS general substrate transporter [Lindgomyces ingoldianus]KAF2472135.1 MFS general substrate transporter [Lindgomyces ingoldianus]
MEKSDADLESGQEPQGIPHWKLILEQGVVTQEISKWDYEGSGTEDDPYVVEWIENDPRNPMQWARTNKWVMCITMAFATLTVSFCSSAYAGGIGQILQQFRTSQEVVTLGISLFVVGFALGPLLWAPFSELYGRQIVFFGTFVAFVAFNAGAAGSQNIWTLIILRFFSGAFGSSPLTNAGGVVADLFTAKERGLAMSAFSIAPFMGPVLGPIVGGFLGMTEGWRWVEGLMAIFSGVVFLVAILLVPETYPPVLLRKRAKTLSNMTGKVYRSRGDIEQGTVTIGEAFSTGLKRPWILLFREPIVFLLSIYMAIIYGTLYMLFGAFPIVYREGRGWNEGISGLPFVGVAIGMVAALVYTILYDNNRYLKCVKNSPAGFATPEDRLPPAIVGGIVLPMGLFWFAWTNYPSLPWAASVAAAMPFGFGMVLIFLSIMNYLIDAYTIFAASVLAANGIIRSLFGAAFPLFTIQMYHNLGIHWASTIPAFLALACLPFPFLFYKYGAKIRQKCKYAAQADEFMKRLHGQIAPKDDAVSEEHEASIQSEKNTEQEVAGSYEEETEPRFAEMKTEKETRNDLEKVRTARSGRSAMSGMTGISRRTSGTGGTGATMEYYDNPYEIDRVHTRESFREGRSRAGSMNGNERRSRASSLVRDPAAGRSRANSSAAK